jgi:hypothetical protein
MKGFMQYVRQREPVHLDRKSAPANFDIIALGFCITLYATLITLFGLAWVLFLIGTPLELFPNLCALTDQITEHRLDQRQGEATVYHQRD